MKLFLKNLLIYILLSALPIIILLVGYLYFDPFKVIYKYNSFSNPFVVPNRDYISTEMFLNHNNNYHYNSFIFGSSRTIAFKPNHWKKHLKDCTTPLVFDASSESVYGISTKLKFLDSKKVDLKNVLIILCRDVAFANAANHEGHLNIKHPIVSKESKLDFHAAFFKAYLTPRFLLSFYDYSFTHKFKPYMKGFIEFRKISQDSITNELSIIDQEDEITSNPESYYKNRANIFYERNANQTVDSVQRIKEVHLNMLNEIKNILDKNNSNYKIVISPLYDQIELNSQDKKLLMQVFGNHLYDFTGKNVFTNTKYNYYETSHYRPVVGDSIMNYIYSKRN